MKNTNIMGYEHKATLTAIPAKNWIPDFNPTDEANKIYKFLETEIPYTVLWELQRIINKEEKNEWGNSRRSKCANRYHKKQGS